MKMIRVTLQSNKVIWLNADKILWVTVSDGGNTEIWINSKESMDVKEFESDVISTLVRLRD